MFLVELVLQGVRGVRELARLRFQSGFNFVAAGNEAGKTSSVDVILRLLFPSGAPEQLDPLLCRLNPDSSRAALVAFSDDGAYYRVIEDFSKRAVNLSRYNPGTKEFGLLYKDWDNTMQFMAGMTGGISEHEYERLFVYRRDHYGARGAAAPAQQLRPAAPERWAPAKAAVNHEQNAALEAHLAELREALRRSEEAADADYRFQSAKLKLEEIRKRQERLAEIDRRTAEIDADIEALKGCENLPADLIEMLEAHEQRQGEKMAKSDELNRDIEDLQAQLNTMPRVNLLTDKIFILGVLVLILSVVAGLFVLTEEQAQYFPLGVLGAVVIIAIAWYKGSVKGTERKAVAREIERLQADLAELEKSFEQGGSAIEACMNATGATTTAELREKAENYRYFFSLREENEEQRSHLGLSAEDLQAEFEKEQQEAVQLEAAAEALARYNIDSYSLRQDIERVEQELAGAASQGALYGGGREFSEDFVLAAAAPAASTAAPGFVTELAIASRVGGIDIETLVPAVEAAAQRNLSTITGGKYIRIEAGQDGDPVVHAKDDSVVSFSQLSHGTRDLVYFCLRTGLVEALAGKVRLPLVLDDPLTGFDPGRQQAACQILRTLGTKTQVILLISNPALKAAGDAAAELK